jgi:ribosomal subunit interface protein
MITIKIKTTNITPNQLLNNFVEKKLKEVEKYIPKDFGAIAEVEVGRTIKKQRTGDIFRAEIQVQMPGGKLLRSVSENNEMQGAVIEAHNNLLIQFEKYKETLASGTRRRKLSKEKERRDGRE